jgi:Fuc2NAc and GlcNAc transferase
MDGIKIFFVSFLSLFIGALAAFLLSKFGFLLGLADVPGERSSHNRTVPKGGGIGIPIAVALTSFCIVNQGYLLVGLSLILSAVALINDRNEMPVGLRLLLEFFLSLAVVLALKKNLLSIFQSRYGFVALLVAGLFFTIYILAATNFFNFMDGINGIAGIEALISFMFLAGAAVTFKKSPAMSSLAFSAAVAAAGFLLFNFPKAKVFMGDVGSIFIGFLFAGMAVDLASNVKEFLLFILFQGVFYVDCLSTILARLLNRENILQAHRKHLYQKLVHHSGWTHTRVALIYGLSQVIIAGLGFVLFRWGLLALILFWAGLFLTYWGILTRLKFIYI